MVRRRYLEVVVPAALANLRRVRRRPTRELEVRLGHRRVGLVDRVSGGLDFKLLLNETVFTPLHSRGLHHSIRCYTWTNDEGCHRLDDECALSMMMQKYSWCDTKSGFRV